MAALVLMLCSLAASTAGAHVNITMPWVRGTAHGHRSTAAFMRLEAHQSGDVTLVAASSPLARSVEMREMRRAKNVAKLRLVDRMQIPAGATLDLKPGSSHLVLVGLKRPIRKGERVPITLVFATADARQFQVDVEAEAMAVGANSHWHRH